MSTLAASAHQACCTAIGADSSGNESIILYSIDVVLAGAFNKQGVDIEIHAYKVQVLTSRTVSRWLKVSMTRMYRNDLSMPAVPKSPKAKFRLSRYLLIGEKPLQPI